MKQRTNPLFPSKNSNEMVVSNLETVEAATGAVSPISKKPMRLVSCAGIPAYFDPDNRLVLPKKA